MSSEPDVWDRPWSGAWLFTVLGPLRGVTAASVRARHAAVLAVLPASAWLRRAEPSLVVEEIAGDGEGAVVDAVLARAGEAWSGPPLVVLVGTGGAAGVVGVLYSHAVGDAAVTRRLVADLVAAPGTPVLAVRRPRPSQLAVAAAGLRYWARDPRRVARAVRRIAAARRAPVTPPSPSATAIGDARVVRCTVTAGQARAIRRRRDREAPARSVSTTLLDGSVMALRARGVPVERVVVPVDLRRYLPAGEPVAGNLISTVTLPGGSGAPAADLAAAVDDGLPLLQFLLTNARWRVLAALGATPGTPAGESVPTLGWSDRGADPGWDALPWADGPRTVLGGALPRGARVVTVYLTRVGGALHLTALVDATAADPAVVAEALDEAVAHLTVDEMPLGSTVA
ncbi:hypothetical protein ACR9E3_16420 [Actinomycetospora sp. C-140]